MRYGLNEVQDVAAGHVVNIAYYEQQAKEAKTKLGQDCAKAQMKRYIACHVEMLRYFDEHVSQN